MSRFLLGLFFYHFFSNSFSQTNLTSQRCDSIISALYKTQRFNGVVLYAEKGIPLLKKAYGISNYNADAALKTSSAFNLASVSKQFICMCIMMLYEEGKLSFEDAVIKYIPSFPYPNITIRNLMTHTSGLIEYFELYMNNRKPTDTLTNDKMIELFATHKPALAFATGSKWEYCNTNYVLLSSIIEKISGERIENFIRQRITNPLSMNDTYMYNVTMPTVPVNHVYGFTEEGDRRVPNDLFHIDGVTGDGNLYSSAEDLLKWDQALYTEKLVRQSTFQQALQPVQLSKDSTYPYGFGWFIDGDGVYHHTGSWVGFYNLIVRDTKNKRTLIVLSNGNNASGIRMSSTLMLNKPYTFPTTYLIRNIKLIDGTGTPARITSVRIEGNKILTIGDLFPYENEKVIEGNGQILAPGFIDTHSHLERTVFDKTQAIPALSQGITTIVSGQDGYSNWMDSIKLMFNKKTIAINVATYTGHTSLREKVMGENSLSRIATDAEINKMQELLKTEMQKGSLGLSTGLEYAGAYFSSKNEVIQLAKTAAAYKGKYISHLRSEDVQLKEAIEEIISIGEEANLPVQISHFKIALKDDWGKAASILAQLETARQRGINITADCYPYEYWRSTLRVLFPKTDYTNLASAEFAVNHTFNPSASVLVEFAPNKNFVGKTISQIAQLLNQSTSQTLITLIAQADAYEKKYPDSTRVEGIVAKSMLEDDIMKLLCWQHTNICSDGSDGGHPRGYGSFTRILYRYVKQKKILTWENAIQKMTSLAAEQTGIQKRGIIAPGYFADMVLINPLTVKDNATIQNPTALSEGILKVWVNGILVFENKKSTNQFPGLFLAK